MAEIYIEVQNYTGSIGLELFAPSSDTNVADQMKDIIDLNNLFVGVDISNNLLLSVPTSVDGFNLTSKGKIDLDGDSFFDSSLWRIRNGESSDLNVNLRGYNTTFDVNYSNIRGDYDTYVISPIFDGAATHILKDLDNNIQRVKASSNSVATGDSLSSTTDNYNITGTDFNDNLTSRSGSDTLTGGLGSDILNLGLGDGVSDSVFYDPAAIANDADTDVIQHFVAGIDKIVLGGGLDLLSNGGTVMFSDDGVSTTSLSNNGNIFAIVSGAILSNTDFTIV